MTNEIIFLTLAEAVEIHADQIIRYGGESGIIDIRLLSSALYMPEATFDGDYLHKDIYEMAAAYIYHICQNHPFVDGNKRTALAAGLVFLYFNGKPLTDPDELLYDAVMKTASGNADKSYLAAVLRKLSEE